MEFNQRQDRSFEGIESSDNVVIIRHKKSPMSQRRSTEDQKTEGLSKAGRQGLDMYHDPSAPSLPPIMLRGRKAAASVAGVIGEACHRLGEGRAVPCRLSQTHRLWPQARRRGWGCRQDREWRRSLEYKSPVSAPARIGRCRGRATRRPRQAYIIGR